MVVVVYLVLAIIVGVAAQNHRGRQGTPWFLISIVLSPVIGALLLFASKDLRQPKTEMVRIASEKTCPQCAEQVKVDAKICRFCRYEF